MGLYAPTGDVSFQYGKLGDLNYVDVIWKTNTTTYEAVSRELLDISGTLYAIQNYQLDDTYSGAYISASLINEDGFDILLGRGAAFTVNAPTDRKIWAYGSSRYSEIYTNGKHQFRIAGVADNTYGKTRILWYPDVRRLDITEFIPEFKDLWVSGPTATLTRAIGYLGDSKVRLLKLYATTLPVGSTVTFKLEYRGRDTPNTTGTYLTNSVVANSSTLEVTDFLFDVPESQWLYLTCSAIASAPTRLNIIVEYQRI